MITGYTERLNWFCEGNVLIIHAVCCKGWIQTVKGFAWCSPVEILLPSYCFCNGERWGVGTSLECYYHIFDQSMLFIVSDKTIDIATHTSEIL